MFTSPLIRKNQTGGPAPSDEQRQDMQEFVTWIKSNVDGFKDKDEKTIVKSLSDMAKSEEGKKSVQELYARYQKSKKQKKAKFEAGGKIHQFICKHGRGGVNCGCGGMVVRGAKGIDDIPNPKDSTVTKTGHVIYPSFEQTLPTGETVQVAYGHDKDGQGAQRIGYKDGKVTTLGGYNDNGKGIPDGDITYDPTTPFYKAFETSTAVPYKVSAKQQGGLMNQNTYRHPRDREQLIRDQRLVRLNDRISSSFANKPNGLDMSTLIESRPDGKPMPNKINNPSKEEIINSAKPAPPVDYNIPGRIGTYQKPNLPYKNREDFINDLLEPGRPYMKPGGLRPNGSINGDELLGDSRYWNIKNNQNLASGFKCGGKVQSHGIGQKIINAISSLASGVQDARDARIGAVGAGPVRQLYDEGRNEEASKYSRNYALANLGGALGAVGADSAFGYAAASNAINPGSVMLGEEIVNGAAPGYMIGISGPVMDEVDRRKKQK